MTASVLRLDSMKKMRIGTHSGTFHADEALGCFLLRRTQKYKDASVTRSRDMDVLNHMDAIVDVGGTYDHTQHRYDHHQRGFTETFGYGFNTKLSSAGLVYRHFGKEIIANETGQEQDSPEVDTLYLALYKHFIEGIDAIDNGVEQWQAEKDLKRGRADDEVWADEAGARIRLSRKYIEETSLSHRVSGLNGQWNEDCSEALQNERFEEASKLAGSEFLSKLKYLSKSWLPAREIVQKALAERHTVDPSGRIIKLDRFCPWKDHLFELEGAVGEDQQVLYCLYQDDREKKWRIICVPKQLGGFENRKSLPAAWRGLRGADLDKAANMQGCTFVHIAGFTGGHNTYDGILDMARASVSDKQ